MSRAHIELLCVALVVALLALLAGRAAIHAVTDAHRLANAITTREQAYAQRLGHLGKPQANHKEPTP